MSINLTPIQKFQTTKFFFGIKMAPMTVSEALQKFALDQPNKKCWCFMDDKGEEVDSITYLVGNFTNSSSYKGLYIFISHFRNLNCRRML